MVKSCPQVVPNVKAGLIQILQVAGPAAITNLSAGRLTLDLHAGSFKVDAVVLLKTVGACCRQQWMLMVRQMSTSGFATFSISSRWSRVLGHCIGGHASSCRTLMLLWPLSTLCSKSTDRPYWLFGELNTSMAVLATLSRTSLSGNLEV